MIHDDPLFVDYSPANILKEYLLTSDVDTAQLARYTYALGFGTDSVILRFANEKGTTRQAIADETPWNLSNSKISKIMEFVDQQRFRRLLDGVKRLRPKSVFSERTEESSASQYFQFYGYLSQQQNMMQDYVRTSTYQRAILGNTADFQVNPCIHLLS